MGNLIPFFDKFDLVSIPIKEYNQIIGLGIERRQKMEYLTTTELSQIWGISSRRISLLCSQGRIEGSIKKGKTWLIPNGAKKPEDPRKNK